MLWSPLDQGVDRATSLDKKENGWLQQQLRVSNAEVTPLEPQPPHPPFQAGLGDHPIVAVGIQPDHQLLRQAEERL